MRIDAVGRSGLQTLSNTACMLIAKGKGWKKSGILKKPGFSGANSGTRCLAVFTEMLRRYASFLSAICRRSRATGTGLVVELYRTWLKMSHFSFNGKPKAAVLLAHAFGQNRKRSRLRLAVKRAIASRVKYNSRCSSSCVVSCRRPLPERRFRRRFRAWLFNFYPIEWMLNS